MTDINQIIADAVRMEVRAVMQDLLPSITKQIAGAFASKTSAANNEIWVQKDVANYLKCSPSYINDYLLPASASNGFPLPCTLTTNKGGVERQSRPKWNAKDIINWFESQPKDLTFLQGRKG